MNKIVNEICLIYGLHALNILSKTSFKIYFDFLYCKNTIIGKKIIKALVSGEKLR